MKVRYIIVVDEVEKPCCVKREVEPGITSVLIMASTPEEAWKMVQEVSQ